MRDMKMTGTRHAGKVGLQLSGLLLSMALMAGCEVQTSDGLVETQIELPSDLALNLYCPEVGIADENCILDDPENPFDKAAVTDGNKFELSAGTTSAKSNFYLWGTALARSQQGENQFYTARALHQLYTEGGSRLAREQAIKAYRSVLDNFFDAFTYFRVDLAEGEVFIPLTLSEETGKSLYTPEQFNLSPLFDNPLQALAAMGSWGYRYDVDSEVVIRNK